MCYYDNYRFACADWKWGNFRSHCQNEYRTGETCGSKLIFQTIALSEKCPQCEKIDKKKRRLAKHKADYARWMQEPNKFRATLEKTYEEMKELDLEIRQLEHDKDQKMRNIGNLRRA